MTDRQTNRYNGWICFDTKNKGLEHFSFECDTNETLAFERWRNNRVSKRESLSISVFRCYSNETLPFAEWKNNSLQKRISLSLFSSKCDSNETLAFARWRNKSLKKRISLSLSISLCHVFQGLSSFIHTMSAKELFWHNCKWQNPHHSHAIHIHSPHTSLCRGSRITKPTYRIQAETLPPNNSWIQEQKLNIETQGREQEEEREAGKETNGIAARGRRHNKGKNELSEAFFTK